MNADPPGRMFGRQPAPPRPALLPAPRPSAVYLPLVSLAITLQVGQPQTLPSGGLAPDPLEMRPPGTVGMVADRLDELDRIVQRGIAAGAFPGAAVVIGRKGFAVHQRGYGRLSWPKRAAPVDPAKTIYDLASLTKPIVLATSAMILVDEGKLRLDDRVKDVLPEYTGANADRLLVRHLLSHHGGIQAGKRLWVTAKNPQQAWRQVLSSPVQIPPGRVMTYSDIGAMIMGKVIERASGMPLDRFARERIFLPLGMHDTFYLPPDSLKYRIAPTEVGPPRGYSLRGEVHDESAWALGKVAGHAGLFGSATDLAIFAQFLLNRGHYGGVRLVQDATVREFTRHVKDNRTLGWEIAAGERGSGEFLSASAYGHTGYTGTSLWIDPERQLFIVLLTNRAHDPRAKRSGIVIADVRHDVADAAALAIADAPVLSAIAWPRDFRVDQAADWNPPTPTAIRRPTTLPRAASASSPNATLNETQ